MRFIREMIANQIMKGFYLRFPTLQEITWDGLEGKFKFIDGRSVHIKNATKLKETERILKEYLWWLIDFVEEVLNIKLLKHQREWFIKNKPKEKQPL